MKIPKREYTAEFKELAVRRIKEGMTPGALSKELGVSEQTVRAIGSRQRRQAS